MKSFVNFLDINGFRILTSERKNEKLTNIYQLLPSCTLDKAYTYLIQAWEKNFEPKKAVISMFLNSKFLQELCL